MRRVDALGAEGALTASDATPGARHGRARRLGRRRVRRLGLHAPVRREDERADRLLRGAGVAGPALRGRASGTSRSTSSPPTRPSRSPTPRTTARGMRTFRFSRADGLVPTGKWIDDDGNGSNFWGVEVVHGRDGERYFAGSDRDFGLQIFRTRAPGPRQRPSLLERPAHGDHRDAPSRCRSTCTDANGNTLTRSIASAPANGTAAARRATARVIYTSEGRLHGHRHVHLQGDRRRADERCGDRDRHGPDRGRLLRRSRPRPRAGRRTTGSRSGSASSPAVCCR